MASLVIFQSNRMYFRLSRLMFERVNETPYVFSVPTRTIVTVGRTTVTRM